MTNDDPQTRSELEAEGIPDLVDATADEGIMAPRDDPVAAEDFGVTPAEDRLDEPSLWKIRAGEFGGDHGGQHHPGISAGRHVHVGIG